MDRVALTNHRKEGAANRTSLWTVGKALNLGLHYSIPTHVLSCTLRGRLLMSRPCQRHLHSFTIGASEADVQGGGVIIWSLD